MAVADEVARYIAANPGSTAREISEGVFGARAGYQPRVNPICLDMCERGEAYRLGAGTKETPYRYYLSKAGA